MLKFNRFIQDREIIRTDNGSPSPLVSVIMPTYCRNKISLKRAVDSVLQQTFQDFEFLIIDDGSRDGSSEVLQEYQKLDSRIVLIKHKLNSGLPALRVDEGILIARGKYVSYQFDDDEWLPDCLATLLEVIKNYDDPCLVYGTCEVQTKSPSGTVRHDKLGKPFNYGLLVNGNYIANNSVLHHKSIVDKCGLYDPHLVARRYSDYDLWLRMAKYVPFLWVDKTITRVFAGEKHSLGVDVEYQLPNIRKYLEIPRDNLLKPEIILEYDVDDVKILSENFTQDKIDQLLRNEIIPFRSKTIYYFSSSELKTANISRPRIRTLVVTKADFSTSVDVTIRNYTHRMNNFPFKYFFLNEALLFTLDANDYDILVLYRTIGNISLHFLRNNKKHKKPTLYMMDDNMFKFYELGEEYSYLKPGSNNYNNLEAQVRESDLIISYNSIISNDCKRYNNKVVDLKTTIPDKYLVHKKINELSNRTRYAILSGNVRKKEIAFLWPVLQDISKRYHDKVEFHFWGINPFEFGKLECPVYHRPFTHSYDNYLDALASSFFHYQICPLDGTLDASRSKSPIKLLEGTIAGAVGIFSNVKPYDSVPNEICFKVENNIKAWLEIFEKTIYLEEEKRLIKYNMARDYIVEEYSSEAQVHSLLAVLEACELHSYLSGKKIAYFFHEAYLGGATLHLFRHVLFARDMGFEVLLCFPENQKDIPDIQLLAADCGLELHYLDYYHYVEYVLPSQLDLKYAEVISQWLYDNHVGLVHSVTYNPSIGIACTKNNIPHLATLHQFYSSKVERNIIRESPLIDFIHSSSNRYARQWSEILGVPARRICCPVGEKYFGLYNKNVNSLFENRREKRILLSGTLQERKNQLSAIKAIKILKERGYSVQLDIIGYDNLKMDYVKQCKDEINQANLINAVNIIGFTNDPELFYENYSDILLCSSLDESMPQTILQAMASGVLVVTTEVGGVKEIIKNDYNGIIASGFEPPELADALEKAITMTPEQIYDMVNNAHSTAKMTVHPDFVRSELLNLYNETYIRSFKDKKQVSNNKQFRSTKLIQLEDNKFAQPRKILPLDNQVKQGGDICGSLPLSIPRTYKIGCTEGKFMGVMLLIGTHDSICNGSLIMELTTDKRPDHVLRKVVMDCNNMSDNEWIEILFEPILSSVSQKYLVTLKYVGSNKLSVYEYAFRNTFIDKVRYKMRMRCSYSMYGYAIYGK